MPETMRAAVLRAPRHVEVVEIPKPVMSNPTDILVRVELTAPSDPTPSWTVFPDPSTVAEAGSLVAPMPGAVVRIEVIQGSRVQAGTPVVVLEAMKMEHTVRAPADGVIAAISVAAGDQVESGQVLAVVSADETV
ncbi:acetyl-CoA carboxylase biotin carboxyl carrier protein subunit [Mycolicibacterium sarraceniae]|uniref:biotin carboxylase n=1 Tax=Mycolicibacterium sarraceniae TaxID=1534348 RepID=A0A7I7SJ85_9MYCO|nr:biotin/lipoyl-containing protein [Mycolicibacterium sarraceniae]BBY57034.1 hypothetical protein MSAR_01700 [Mycolicibacterium sarraceniae]